MLPKSRMDHTAIEKDLGSVRDVVKLFQGFVECIIIVVGQRRNPRFDFLRYTVSNLRSN